MQRFLIDPYTLDVLYPGEYLAGKPSDRVKYLADHVTGLRQHSYAMERHHISYGSTEELKWLSQARDDQRPRDKEPELRWGGVRRVATISGHKSFPKLHLEVTIRASQLPVDSINRKDVQALLVAWLECGLRCPVLGCEPWAALDPGNKDALPKPQALVI